VTAELIDGEPVLHAADLAAWRDWLAANADTTRAVWLVVTRGAGAGYVEATEHALCFGWIDGKALRRDAQSTYQRFSPRNPRSTWSKVNRERADRLTAAGLMAPQGQSMIDLAKQSGTWDGHADAENGVVPDDLAARLAQDPVALAHFEAFPPSSRRLILTWIATAKRPETRQRRIARTVELAHDDIRANHPATR
jgi:uncharacterized protein YdeI (YjbR/CyaY-like superfamily)